LELGEEESRAEGRARAIDEVDEEVTDDELMAFDTIYSKI